MKKFDSHSYQQKTQEVSRDWHLVDAKGQILGRMATQIATWLMGKHKPTYTPHIDAGDFVLVINATQVAVTGNKKANKIYYSYSGFPGGLTGQSLEKLQTHSPEKVIELAVYNMLPDNRLRANRMKRLKIYAYDQHPHQSQIATNQAV